MTYDGEIRCDLCDPLGRKYDAVRRGEMQAIERAEKAEAEVERLTKLLDEMSGLASDETQAATARAERAEAAAERLAEALQDLLVYVYGSEEQKRGLESTELFNRGRAALAAHEEEVKG